MHLHLSGLLDDFEGVAVHLYAKFKLEFEDALILAIDCDRTLVLGLARRRLVVVDHPVGHQKVPCL